MPDRGLPFKVVRRQSGLGSLGQPRYAAIATWDGGYIAREGKALVPSAYTWLTGRVAHGQPWYARALGRAVRARDPYHRCVDHWRMRRLSPDADPIAIDDWPADRDEVVLLHAMGTEAANVHMGSPRSRAAILSDLRRRRGRWLRDAAKAMAKVTDRDWDSYRT